MHTSKQAGGHVGRSAYFQRIAGEAREQLAKAEADLINFERQAAGFHRSAVPIELANRLNDAKRRVREFRARMTRALHNAGR